MPLRDICRGTYVRAHKVQFSEGDMQRDTVRAHKVQFCRGTYVRVSEVYTPNVPTYIVPTNIA